MLKKLIPIFPVYPIPNIKEEVSLGEEEYDDLHPLDGKSWTEIANDENYMETHYTFPCWLRREQIIYYLPAIIVYTYNYANSEYSLPDVCLHMRSLFKKGRYFNMQGLTQHQIDIVKRWIAYTEYIEMKEFENAQKIQGIQKKNKKTN